ncbi:MAG TPA: acyltransferase family protein [Rhizomicrobium sp.]|nr:acyltransferase family protein [Rhizomicrobium sp.]
MKYAIDRFAAGAGLETPKSTSFHARLTGLDGLRAVAVVAVFLFHAEIPWAQGGYLGVDLFFVISGFLITGLLTAESEASGRLNLVQFYWRRAKRLLPASYLMTAAAVAAAALLAPDALPRLRWDTLASLAYVTNWELITSGRSYFEAMGRQPLLLHLWSLAIEEQFYIVWAPVIALVLPRLGRRTLAALAGVAAVAAAAWMAHLAAKMGYPEQGDPTRLYFGTDTHGFPLLIGAVLGLLWRPGRQRGSRNPAVREGMFILGLGALAAMLALIARLGEQTAWLYPWGLLLSAGASTTLIAAATWRGSAFGRLLDAAPLRWIGERSYGIYLWHWPIFMLTRPDLDLHWPQGPVFGLRVALTLTLSGLSYRYVEMPIRQGALDRLWTALKAPQLRPGALRRGLAPAIAAGAAAVAVATVLILAPNQVAPAEDVREALSLSDSNAPPPLIAKRPAPVMARSVAGQSAATVFTGADLTAVGDSVLLGSSGVLKNTLPGAQVYAAMGWQAADVLKQLKTLQQANALTAVVLIHLGTNGYIVENQLRTILSMLAGRKSVILVNTHVPRRWMEPNNELMDRIAADYPNVVLADWKEVSDGQPDFFVSDGVHLTIPGERAFVAEIMRAGHLASGAAPARHAVDPSRAYAFAPGDLSRTLVRNPQAAPADDFWYRMASCETGANWQNGGRFAGGLGIFLGAWKSWGGEQFAATPGLATPAQQIAVANRISTQGWQRPDGSMQAAIGFGSWGCTRVAGKLPPSSPYTFTPQSVLAQQFHLAERGDVVRDLELMLGLKRDGIYGRHTRKLHLAYLKARGLSPDLAAPETAD